LTFRGIRTSRIRSRRRMRKRIGSKMRSRTPRSRRTSYAFSFSSSCS